MANKPKPTALKLVQGTQRKDRTNTKEPAIKSRLPKCPAWINAEGKKEWSRLLKDLNKHGIATGFDFIGLATLCQMWGEYVEGSKNGEPVGAAHITQMRLLLVEFGMTPSSRSKVNAQPAEEKQHDPWDDL